MWLSQKGTPEKNDEGNGLVAVGLDRDKGSQHALKWAVDHVLSRGQTVILIHVKVRSSQSLPGTPECRSKVTTFDNVEALRRSQKIDQQTKELFLPFRFFCTRKDVVCRNVVLEDTDVAKALIEYASNAAIETLVIGASSKHGFLKRFKGTDISSTVSKQAPDFCNVYVINKGKIASMRTASCAAPAIPRIGQMRSQPSSCKSEPPHPHLTHSDSSKSTATDISAAETPRSTEDLDIIKSPFTRRGCRIPSRNEIPIAESDLSFVSTDTSFYDQFDSDNDFMGSFKSVRSGRKTPDVSYKNEYTSFSQNMDDVEAEMRRLKQELRQTMDMYSRACKEALTAKQKSDELARWKIEEERRVTEARMSEEVALSIAEKEKAKARAALEAAEAQQRIALLEAQKRVSAEMKALKEKQEKMKVFDALANSDARYRKYTIDDIEQATEFFNHSSKVGEGGYGPVYKGYLDHTAVAIKILRPDASQGRSQFQQEIEVLSNIRHPNMVLLLGACPEYGCLVYEYMANGSLEDCLFRKGDKPVLSWQLRFRIAAEIGTGLLFLHQTKPEPLVHRDLKPGNILLDQNYTSKISDVGLARLVPPSVSNSITQLRMTSTAGTFCYIDPEYQQTGMLGVKSDVYSLGIMLLQLVTAKNAMGLAHHAQKAIDNGKFGEMLDPAVPDWPVEEAVGFAKLALRCAELRRKDRPDLATEILPELERLRSLAEDNMPNLVYGGDIGASPSYSRQSIHQDVMSDHLYLQSAESSSSRLSG